MTDDIIYDSAPSPEWLANEAKIKAKAVVQHVALPDTDDIVELARAAIPALVRRAVALAHESDSLNAVVGVLNALADRAYGKPTQHVEAEITVEHVDRMIRVLEDKVGPVDWIDGEEVDAER